MRADRFFGVFGWLTKWLVRSPQVASPRAEATEPTPAPVVVASSRVTPTSVLRLEHVFEGLRAKRLKLPVQDVASLGLMLLDALDGAGGEHLRMPDPRNLLLVRDGTIRVLGAAHGGRHGSLGGRIHWLTPEGVEGRALTERSDVFSVCSVLFAAATSRAPFAADSEVAALMAIREGAMVGTLETLRPEFPPSFAQLVHRGLEVEPHRRIESLQALRGALVPFTGGLEVAREAFLERAFRVAPPKLVVAPETGDDAAIVSAIANGDESARLVYADLLEERGLGDHARWLRAESRIQATPNGPDRDVALRELRALRELVGREFLAAVARPAIEGCPVRFGFRCPLKWEALTVTSDPAVRHCAGCDSPVTFFDSLEAAQLAAAQGKCVAIDLSVERHEGDLDAERHATVGMIA